MEQVRSSSTSTLSYTPSPDAQTAAGSDDPFFPRWLVPVSVPQKKQKPVGLSLTTPESVPRPPCHLHEHLMSWPITKFKHLPKQPGGGGGECQTVSISVF